MANGMGAATIPAKAGIQSKNILQEPLVKRFLYIIMSVNDRLPSRAQRFYKQQVNVI